MNDFVCAHTQEGEGLIVPGTERHARLFEVRTRTLAHLRQLKVSITRENTSFAHLIERRKRRTRQNNNRPIILLLGNNILHILHVHHLTQE